MAAGSAASGAFGALSPARWWRRGARRRVSRAAAMLSSRAQAAMTAADRAIQRFLRTGAAVR